MLVFWYARDGATETRFVKFQAITQHFPRCSLAIIFKLLTARDFSRCGLCCACVVTYKGLCGACVHYKEMGEIL